MRTRNERKGAQGNKRVGTGRKEMTRRECRERQGKGRRKERKGRNEGNKERGARKGMWRKEIKGR